MVLSSCRHYARSDGCPTILERSSGQRSPSHCSWQAERGSARFRVGNRGLALPLRLPSPVDRSRPGSKHHLLTDGNGIPVVVPLTAANCSDINQLYALVDDIPRRRGARGRPRLRPRPCTPIAATTRSRTASDCGSVRSSPSWHDATRSTEVDWGSTVGSWSERSPGFTSSDACASASNVDPRFTKRSSRSARPSSAGGSSRTHCERGS